MTRSVFAKMGAAFLLLPAVACGGGMHGDDAPPDANPTFTDELEAIRAAHGIPALAAAVGGPAGIVEVAAAGVRRAGRPDLGVTADDQFHLGSCTKAMTATLIAMAVDEGRLRWTTTLAEALPALGASMHPDHRATPLPWLLAHRAGTWTETEAHLEEIERRIPSLAPVEVQRAVVAEVVLGAPPELAPGTATAYSNANFVIAGAILEATYGRPWESLVRDKLFAPLGMTSCGFGPPGTTAAATQPWGHAGEAMTPLPPDAPSADNPPVYGPAGAVHCNLTDWARFLALHLGGEGAPALVSPSSLEVLHTAVGEMALGWDVVPFPRFGTILVHSGSNKKWYVQAVVAPERRRTLMVATNSASQASMAALRDASRLVVERVAP